MIACFHKTINKFVVKKKYNGSKEIMVKIFFIIWAMISVSFSVVQASSETAVFEIFNDGENLAHWSARLAIEEDIHGKWKEIFKKTIFFEGSKSILTWEDNHSETTLELKELNLSNPKKISLEMLCNDSQEADVTYDETINGQIIRIKLEIPYNYLNQPNDGLKLIINPDPYKLYKSYSPSRLCFTTKAYSKY